MMSSFFGAGSTLLHTAAKQDDVETCVDALNGGADINQLDGKGRTALHAAIELGHDEVVALLVSKGK
jgi:ankyrin repeat protein